jgi:hypothetical protein
MENMLGNILGTWLELIGNLKGTKARHLIHNVWLFMKDAKDEGKKMKEENQKKNLKQKKNQDQRWIKS